MLDLPDKTMLTYLLNPMFDKIDVSDIHVSRLLTELEGFRNKYNKKVAPETEALKFYFLNHIFHIMKTKFNESEILDDEMIKIAEKHIVLTNEIAKRLFFYNILIAIEEANFMYKQESSFYDFLERSYGKEFSDWVNNGFGKTLTSFGKLNMTCGEFSAAMVSVFAFAKWQHGFGGKGWVPIATSVADCIHGIVSFEQMADQAFSLCHNNGSMFNKGHLYDHYSSFIYKILDIQDSGQIPQWIGENLNNKYIDKEIRGIYEIVAKRFPAEITGSLDQSLIKNSEKKREQKTAALAKKNASTWNSGNTQTVKPHEHKIDKILVDLFKKGF